MGSKVKHCPIAYPYLIKLSITVLRTHNLCFFLTIFYFHQHMFLFLFVFWAILAVIETSSLPNYSVKKKWKGLKKWCDTTLMSTCGALNINYTIS